MYCIADTYSEYVPTPYVCRCESHLLCLLQSWPPAHPPGAAAHVPYSQHCSPAGRSREVDTHTDRQTNRYTHIPHHTTHTHHTHSSSHCKTHTYVRTVQYVHKCTHTQWHTHIKTPQTLIYVYRTGTNWHPLHSEQNITSRRPKWHKWRASPGSGP